jgi:hypothetical protein
MNNNPVYWTGRAVGLLLGCAVLLALQSAAARAERLDFTGSAWERAARPHGLDPALLYAVAMVESRRNVDAERVGPWPWVIRTPTGGYWFDSRAQAERGLRAVLAKWPPRRVDVGVAQVNLGWHRERYDDPMSLLDLETNLHVAAAILAEAIGSTADTVLGVGRYHHWVSEDRSRAYGQRVWLTYRTVTFGHTAPARRYALVPVSDTAPAATRVAENQ